MATFNPIPIYNGVIFQQIISDVTGQNLLAIHSRSNIYISNDGGISWTFTSPVTNAVTAAADSSFTNIVLATCSIGTNFSFGTIYRSTDGGHTFSNTNSISYGWNGITSDASGQYIAAYSESNSVIYYSIDYCANFIQSTTSPQIVYGQIITSICSSVSGQYVFISLAQGYVYYSSDYGASFSSIFYNAGSWIAQVVCDASGQKLYAGISNNTNGLYRFTKNGNTWIYTRINPSPADISNLICDSSGQYLLACDTSTVNTILYYSSDYGSTWLSHIYSTGISDYIYQIAINQNATKFYVTTTINNVNSVFTGSFLATCFNYGTQILTDNGYIEIQYLKQGDMIKTFDSGYKPIQIIGYNQIYHNYLISNKSNLYILSKEQYPELSENLIITGNHSILIDSPNTPLLSHNTNKTKDNKSQIHILDMKINKTCENKKNNDVITYKYNLSKIGTKYRLPANRDSRAKILNTSGIYTIYHLALKNDSDDMYDGIYANGLLVESTSVKDLMTYNMKLL